MTPTTDYIREKFDEYNGLCFNGRLTPPPFRISNARTFLGMVRFKRQRNRDKTWHYHSFEFVISRKIALLSTEREMDDVILHEMIHYYILSNQLQDDRPHGTLFKQLMTEINTRFGRHITTSHRRTEEEKDKDTDVRRHIICVSRFYDNRCGITVATRTRIHHLWNELSLISDIKDCTWYMSTDPFFNRFPRAIKAKVYLISPEDLQAHLSTAIHLIKKGNMICMERKPQ